MLPHACGAVSPEPATEALYDIANPAVAAIVTAPGGEVRFLSPSPPRFSSAFPPVLPLLCPYPIPLQNKSTRTYALINRSMRPLT